MAISKKMTDKEQVTAHIASLDPLMQKIIGYLRKIILSASAEVAEQVKWNSPAFYYTGAMKPFDPKEYKRDIVVINHHRGKILLVFPTGASVKSDHSILEGSYKDGRRIVTITDEKDAKAKATPLQAIIREWISLVE